LGLVALSHPVKRAKQQAMSLQFKEISLAPLTIQLRNKYQEFNMNTT